MRFECEWFWPPCSPDINPYDYFLWDYLKYRVYLTNPVTVQEMEALIEAVAEEITGDMLRDSGDRL
jgi:transposase